MDVFRNSKLVVVEDWQQELYAVLSFQRGDEARIQFGAAESRRDWTISAIEIDAEDAGRLLECLQTKTWESSFDAAVDEIHLKASRRNSGDPYSEGFEIEVSEIKAGNDWGDRVFGGYFEDGCYLDRIKEVLQHCVDLDQTLKSAPAP
jgi:hypothetical protein